MYQDLETFTLFLPESPTSETPRKRRSKLVRCYRRNKLVLFVCVFGCFWCIVASLVVLFYMHLLQGKDIPFDVPPPTKSPCVGHFCAFYATCLVNQTSGTPYCACVDKCEDDLEIPICGSDGQTHTNECKLRLASCHRQRRIKLRHEGQCLDPCAGVKCEGQQVCKLNEEREPVCTCEVSCEPTISYVCGSDGQTYSNQCMLQQQACRHGKTITTLYTGKCREDSNPCRQKQCDSNQDCLVDRHGKAVCVCPSVCAYASSPVCGSDGVTYDSLCHLRKLACETQSRTTLVYAGDCSSAPDPKHVVLGGIDQGLCKDYVCPYDAVCTVRKYNRECECPKCQPPEPYSPVCGVNGITYENDCMRKKENCEQRKYVPIEHAGHCVTNCHEDSSICKHYSSCEHDDMTGPRCVCPTDCAQVRNKVCGTDGITYNNQCELQVASCQNQTIIEIATLGECEKCNGIQCKYGSRCEHGRCVCPQVCPDRYEPVCASDGKTYPSMCEMNKAACQNDEELERVRSGECDYDHESGSGEEGSGLQDCDETNCRFGGTCQIDMSGSVECKCAFSCDAIRSPVCGSNGVTYGNKCELQAAMCRQQIEILQVSMDSCDEMDEVLCDGLPPVINGNTGDPFSCGGSHDCPSGSYCHLQFSRCCSEEVVSDTYIRDCADSEYGCCEDGMTSSPGPNNAGCPDMCQCHPVGSLGRTCDPETKQCPCKPGVGETKCDACLFGYWGLKLIQEQNRAGCIPCNCNPIGSVRPDCDQNTGRCECRDGYKGHKCDRCSGTGLLAGSHGCSGGAYTATPQPTISRRTPRHTSPSDNNLTIQSPSAEDSTSKPPIRNFPKGQGRIDDLCEEGEHCPIPHSHCIMTLCKCDPGYISTHESTVCSKVEVFTDAGVPEVDTCSMDPNPCRHGSICRLDDDLGYRCLCSLGRTGITCNQRTSIKTPSFSGSAYLRLSPIGNVSGDFQIDVAFRTFNMDGIILFASQREDGTGQFISLAINYGQVEFRYDTGSGPKEITHSQVLTRNSNHQVIAMKKDERIVLVVDGTLPIADKLQDASIDLSGRLYLGNLPSNMTFLQEKIGKNMGYVGCILSLSSTNQGRLHRYDLQYPGPSDMIAGFDIVSCEQNSCKDLPCKNGGTCVMLYRNQYQCMCRKGYRGVDCDDPLDKCTDSPCHESSTCSIADDGSILCHCPPTREGQNCEYEKLPEVEVPMFHGDSYLVLPLNDNLSQQTSIEIWFMTSEENGMLAYTVQSLGGHGDYMSLNIVDLTVELRYNLGDAPVIVTSSQKLTLGAWHRVSLKRILKKAELTLDGGVASIGESQGSLTELQFNKSLMVGGYKHYNDVPQESQIKYNLSGVIQRIYINGRLIEEPISSSNDRHHVTQYRGLPCNVNPCMNGGVCFPRLDDAECQCPKRYYGQRCEKVAEQHETSQPIRFDGINNLVYNNEISMPEKSQQRNKLQFQFRSHQTSGLLMFQGDGPSVAQDYLAVALSEGYVELSYNLGAQKQGRLLRSRSTIYVSDGEWHTVHVERNDRSGMLQVDKEPMITTQSDEGALQLNTDGFLWIGGKKGLPHGLPEDYYRGFKGCLGYVFILDKELHLYNDRDHLLGGSLNFCSH